ncbi:MAG: MerR family transcriptional regulator [Lachnospiraceae bacterium]|nr:MerR family transcriptional regulator [Lachnospiraceae bacterium]
MKINEVEEFLQISKANIRFYEKEGLLTPARSENGYRDYSEEDVERLKKIIILRKMGMAIPDIRGVLSEELSMDEAIEKTVAQLEEQMAQLNGSLKLAGSMKASRVHNADFDVEQYWNMINDETANGSKFMEIVSDYIELEKKSLITMWESVFLVPLSDIATEKGWKYAILTIIGLCVLRGIGKAFIFHSGSFIEGFGYPLLLFSIMTVITLPLYIMDYRYKDFPLPEPKKVRFRYSLLKTILILIVFLFVLFGVPVVCENVYTLWFENEDYIIDYLLWPVYFIVSFYLFCLLLWMFYDYGLFSNLYTGEYGLRCHLPKNMRRKVLVCSVMVYLLGIGCDLTCYDCFTTDGVERRVLLYDKKYTWNDVDHFTLQNGNDGVLDYVVVMKDGMRCKCIGGDVGSECLSEERYPHGTEDYCIELTEKFVEMGIPLTDTDFDKLHDRLIEYWSDYLEKIEEVIKDN